MIFNENCITGCKHFHDETIDLIICDPPFGIQETTFDKHYNRNENNVIKGYIEAPEDYYQFSLSWITQAKRILKPNGSMYIISGWTNLKHILNAIDECNLKTINHLIWKYNFGVYTKNKYVSSHYHILYVCKQKGKPKFNTYCRFNKNDRKNGRSLNYRDLEDVFVINKEYSPGEIKNKNKLPDALVEKLISYSSDENDLVADFFLGNFTTAIVSKKMNRIPCGFEINPISFQYGIQRME